LFAVPFDLDKLETRGTAVPILDDVAYNGSLGAGQFSFSPAPSGRGTLIYRKKADADAAMFTVAWLDNAGKTEPLLAKPAVYARPSLSPDGQRLALPVSGGAGSGRDIWVYEWKRDIMTRLTFTGNALNPTWSPDSRYIAFESQTAAEYGIFAIRTDGAGQLQPLTQSKGRQQPWSFTPDGKRLAFHESANDGTNVPDLWTVPVQSDGAVLRAGKPEVFLQTTADERHPSFSPDGRWIAYDSNESGTYQVYVRAFPDKGGKWQVSNAGGAYPAWSRAGHELFFEAPDGHIMAAAYTVKGDSLISEKPRQWSPLVVGVENNAYRVFDPAPDGKRMAVLMPASSANAESEARNHVGFLENFLDELRRKVPAGK
jgi:serine/threonine-protein kinase